MKTLVVGATGMVGSQICRLLRAQEKHVRALVRSTSDPDKVAALKGLGAEVVLGDLKNPASLREACRDVNAIVSTASSTHSHQEGDSIQTVDAQGQRDLIEAAEAGGVEHFVLISFPKVDVDFPLQQAKRAAEDRLRASRMTHTILQPTFFMEVWLSPALGFDVANGTAQIYGDGQQKSSWISFKDVARFAVAALDNPRAVNVTVKLGGPDALSPLQVVRLAEQAKDRTVAVNHVPEEALRAQHGAATDSMQKTFAGLMIYNAHGDVIDLTDARRVLSVEPLTSVRDYLGAKA